MLPDSLMTTLTPCNRHEIKNKWKLQLKRSQNYFVWTRLLSERLMASFRFKKYGLWLCPGNQRAVVHKAYSVIVLYCFSLREACWGITQSFLHLYHNLQINRSHFEVISSIYHIFSRIIAFDKLTKTLYKTSQELIT